MFFFFITTSYYTIALYFLQILPFISQLKVISEMRLHISQLRLSVSKLLNNFSQLRQLWLHIYINCNFITVSTSQHFCISRLQLRILTNVISCHNWEFKFVICNFMQPQLRIDISFATSCPTVKCFMSQKCSFISQKFLYISHSSHNNECISQLQLYIPQMRRYIS